MNNLPCEHFLSHFEHAIREYWQWPALSDYGTDYTLTYGQMANEMNRLHVLFERFGLKKGDKIAICSPNCANWALSFLTVMTFEGVVVSILPDFQSESIQGLVNHSGSTLLIVSNKIWKGLDFKAMPGLVGALSISDFSVLETKDEAMHQAYAEWADAYQAQYPEGIQAADVHFPTDNWEDTCLINYTSGTTSAPKGVMLSYKNISSNVQYGLDYMHTEPGYQILSMLPLAHMFGLAFEFLYPICGGTHIFFLNRTPSPQILLKALADIRPYLLITVPLVLEKIIRKNVIPSISKWYIKLLWNLPPLSLIIRKKVCDKVMNVFGGNLHCLIIGGAAISEDVEDCLKQMKFPYTVGYGMTECAPIIAYCDWRHYRKKSCGHIVDRMDIKIESTNQRKKAGEILVKGDNVMQGYYQNEEATKTIFTSDGWMRTGDMGVIDKKGNIFIKGRCKNMILGASGQNIYPEEIEDKLNAQPLVVESLIVHRDDRLVGLVYPDYEGAKKQGLDKAALLNYLEQTRQRLNKMLPHFSQLAKVETVDSEFEKTPKRSIKRFLYK